MTKTVPAGVGLTPRLVLDEAVMLDNVARMAKAVIAEGGRRLRPHFKTSKMIEVANAQRASGAIGFTCATVAELEALIGAGVDDLLWAHEPVGDEKVAAAIDLNRRAKVAVAIDSPAVAKPLSQAAAAAGMTLPYLVEIDTGLGRAGVKPDAAVAFAKEISTLPGLRLEGVFTHEGHLYGVRDAGERAVAGTALGATLAGVGRALRDAGFPADVVSVGSTPAAASAPFADGVTEARPGTYVFNDGNQAFLGAATRDQCAVHVVACVVSRPRPGAAVIDAGLKAMSSDRSLTGHGFGVVEGFPDVTFDAAYEEHGLLTGPGADRLRVGDLVAILPNHVCGCVNMWSSALVVRDGAVADEWKVVARH